MIIGFMENIFSKQFTDWRDGRRLRAFELHQMDWKQKDIADALGVSKGAVSQWLKRAKEGGVEGLRRRKPPGAPCRLIPEQRAQLPQLLARGAESFGFRGDLWTQPRVATVIRREFGVSTILPRWVASLRHVAGVGKSQSAGLPSVMKRLFCAGRRSAGLGSCCQE